MSLVSMTAHPQAHTLHASLDGERRAGCSVWYLGEHLMSFLATGRETAGRFSLIETHARKGFELPLHVHRHEDEHFYLLEGEVTFYIGHQVLDCRAGSWAVVPKGVEHTFVMQTAQATALVLYTPAGFEEFFREMGEPADTQVEPPARAGLPDITRLITTASKYGCEFPRVEANLSKCA